MCQILFVRPRAAGGLQQSPANPLLKLDGPVTEGTGSGSLLSRCLLQFCVYTDYLPFPKVRAAVTLAIRGPAESEAFKGYCSHSLVSRSPGTCSVKWCVMRECPLEKVKPAAGLSRRPASRAGAGGKSAEPACCTGGRRAQARLLCRSRLPVHFRCLYY